jgi:hypothetical protein
MVLILTYVLTGNFLLLFLYLGCIRIVFHLDISSSCWLRVIRVLCFLGLCSLSDGVGDRWSGMVHMHTLGGLWKQVCEIGLFVDETILLYKAKLSLKTTLLKCWTVRIFRLPNDGLKEF